MKNVIVGGMPQAGSTLCFNLIREMVEINGMGVQVRLGGKSQYSKAGSESKRIDYSMVKNHTNMGGNFQIKINVRRDIRDSVASNKRKDPNFLNGNVINIADRNLSWYNSFVGSANYEFVYEDYKSEPLKTMVELNDLFGFELSEEQLQEVINISENIQNQDLSESHQWGHPMWNKTLMSEKHITSNKGKIGGYKDTLTEAEIKLLEDKYGQWLKDKGYEE